MDELEISGKRYISSRRAAKEHKYHSDYIGQLVRGGKVEGQKVGRAWYVHAESLAVYLGKLPAAQATPLKVTPVAPPISQVQPQPAVPLTTYNTEPKAHVAEFIKEETRVEEFRIPVSVSRPSTVFKEEYVTQPEKKVLRYLSDDEPLFPAINIKKPIRFDPSQFEDTAIETPMPVVTSHPTRVVPPTPTLSKKRPLAWSVAFVVVVGVAAFSVAAGGSYFLNYVMTLQGTQLTAIVTLPGNK